MDEFRLSQQCVANAIFLRQMNIQIYAWPQNLMNICQMTIFVYRYLNIHIYSNIYNVKKKNNKCMSKYISGHKIEAMF